MMLTHTTRWSHPPGNPVVPSGWRATDLRALPADDTADGAVSNPGHVARVDELRRQDVADDGHRASE